ncbi:MAG: ISKra4 family transposase [Chloroflexota bacterium]|nr:ISKra4 family transposase [Chloroflexota bacterium]
MRCLRESITHGAPALQAPVKDMREAQSLAALLWAAWQLARLLAVQLVEEVLAERAAHPTTWPNCRACGARLESKGLASRQLTTLLGVVKWARRVGRCPHRCRIGQVVPLDEQLGLYPNQRTGRGLQRLACGLALFVPFETVVLLLARLLGIEVSVGAVWQWVQAAGAAGQQRLAQRLAQVAAGERAVTESGDAATAALPLVIQADGVMVPFRPQGGQPQGRVSWREVKVGLVARLGQRLTRSGRQVTQVARRRLVAVRGSVDQLAPRLWEAALREGVLAAGSVAWLSDGSRGLWRLYQEQFGELAVGILDFYHAAQNLWQGAKAWLDGRTTRARQWFARQCRQLKAGQADTVLRDLAAALDLEGLPPAARERLHNVYTYLETHRNHLDYATYQANGLPIGSGMIESACKWLIQQRFKGVGMRWSEAGFDHLLHLRLAWVNDEFDALFACQLSPT